jgi:hypothetical protein
LHPFVFNELKVATELLGDMPSGHSESDLANVVHPSLCPLLILLSRLKPSTIASETGDDLDPFLFMPFIRRCSTQSNLRVRVLASRALTGIVSNEKLPIVLLNIASELPCVENQHTASPVSLDVTQGSRHISLNSVHGLLLQLSSLLDLNCRDLADFSKKDQILGELIQVLVMRSWIASPRMCPCPILNASFLRVLDHTLSIARTCSMSKSFYAIRNLLLESSRECLDIEASYGLSYYDPTIAELREHAAFSYFSCVFQASKEVSEEFLQIPQRCPQLDSKLSKLPEIENTFAGLQERLICSLSDTSYEVRLATLKWLLKFLKATEPGCEVHDLSSSEIRLIQNWTKTNLQATMMKLLDLEKNNRCTYYILRILFAWNLLQVQKLSDEKGTQTFYIGVMECDSLFQFWDKLISLYKLTRQSKTRETLICCMGICVKRFASLFLSILELRKSADHCKSDQLEISARLYDCISFFTSLIKQHSASSEPINMRKAAAESVIASGLLEQAVLIGSSVLNDQMPDKDLCSNFEPNEALNKYARQILDIWFTCIQLLEDEDDGIRQRLALDVQKCFLLEGCGSAGKVPTQVEKVIVLCFDHLSSIFAHWIEYFDYLLQWVLNATGYAVCKGDLVRRVFDKEIDNHHEEKLLICQLCCFHLEMLPVSKSWAVKVSDKEGLKNSLYGWRHRFCHQLMVFAKDYVEKQEGVDWIGGVGNHKDAFLPLYANLLAFYTLSKCIFNGNTEDGTPLLSDVVELGRTINPFLRNPLIFNLYLLVVRLHQNNVGTTADHLIPEFRDDCIWDGFDPYFLLR